MSNIQMNKFEIIDLPGMNTIAFLIEENHAVTEGSKPSISLEKLDSSESEVEGKVKKTFYVLPNGEEKQTVVLLTLTKNKALFNVGIVTEDGFEMSNDNVPLAYGTVYNQEGIEYKEFPYDPNSKRHFSIIDTETGEEIRPVLYIDQETKALKGKCKLLPMKPYVILEIKNSKG